MSSRGRGRGQSRGRGRGHSRGRGGNGGGGRGRGGFNGGGRGGGNAQSRKEHRRNRQQAAVDEKSSRDDAFYFSEVNRFQHSQGRTQNQQYRRGESEHELFATSGPAGLKFDQYDEIKVERSGQNADSIPALQLFSQLGSSLPPFLGLNVNRMQYVCHDLYVSR